MSRSAFSLLKTPRPECAFLSLLPMSRTAFCPPRRCLASAERAGQRPGDGEGEGPRCDYHAGLDPGDVPPGHRAHPQRRQLVKPNWLSLGIHRVGLDRGGGVRSSWPRASSSSTVLTTNN